MEPYVPEVVVIVGFVLWFICTRPKTADGMLADMGRWMFILGLAATLYFGIHR